jgi:hypothetical protein
MWHESQGGIGFQETKYAARGFEVVAIWRMDSPDPCMAPIFDAPLGWWSCMVVTSIAHFPGAFVDSYGVGATIFAQGPGLTVICRRACFLADRRFHYRVNDQCHRT